MMTDTEGTRGGTRVWVLVVAALAVLAVSGIAAGLAAQTGPTAESVLDGVEQRYDTAESYTGVVVTEGTYDNGTETVTRTAEVRVQYAAPDDYRAEVLAPGDAEGTVAATNGSVAWTRRAGGATLVRPVNDTRSEWLDRVNVSATVDRLREDATVTYEGTETRDGVETYVLGVEPDNESDDASATVYVATDDYRVEAIESVARHDGTQVTTTTRFESFTFGVDIHRSTFQPPTDRQVVVAASERTTYESLAAADEAVSFAVETPDLRDGFSLQEVAVAEGGGQATVTATYGNGSATVAVVQSDREPPTLPAEAETDPVTVGDREARSLDTGEYGVVFWSDEGGTTAVTGSVSEERLVAVAASLD